MKQAYSRGISGLGQFGILTGLIGVGFVLAGIISILVWVIMADSSISSMATDMLKPQNRNALLTIQVVTTAFAFFVPAVAFAFICYRKGWTYLGFSFSTINMRQVAGVIMLAICALPLISALGELNKAIPIPLNLKLKFDAMEKDYMDQVSIIAQVKTWGQYLLSLLVIAALPAIVEETLFRGALQNMLTRWTKMPWLAIIIASFIFSAIHISWYGFIPRFVLGMVLGLLFYYGQSIWMNILAHFINNAMVVTGLFVAYQQGKKVDISADEHFPMWGVAISVLLVAGAIALFISSSPKPEPVEEITFDDNPFQTHVE